MIKYLVSDLDGTLLKADQTIDKEDIKAINDFNKSGGHFWVASGRPITYLKELLDFGINVEYMLGSTGATISDGQTEELLASINKEDGLKMIEYLDNIDGLEYLIDSPFKMSKSYGKVGSLMASHIRTNKVLKALAPKTYFAEYDSLLKFFAKCSSDELALEVIDDINKNFDNIKALHADYMCIEIISSKTGKWQALSYLLDKLKIDKSEVAAIGDEGNDVEMIRNCALGFAMAKAKKETKEASDVIVNSVKEAIDYIRGIK